MRRIFTVLLTTIYILEIAPLAQGSKSWIHEYSTLAPVSPFEKADAEVRQIADFIGRYEKDSHPADVLHRAMVVDYVGRAVSGIVFRKKGKNRVKSDIKDLASKFPELKLDGETILIDKRNNNTAFSLGSIRLGGEDKPVIVALLIYTPSPWGGWGSNT